MLRGLLRGLLRKGGSSLAQVPRIWALAGWLRHCIYVGNLPVATHASVVHTQLQDASESHK